VSRDENSITKPSNTLLDDSEQRTRSIGFSVELGSTNEIKSKDHLLVPGIWFGAAVRPFKIASFFAEYSQYMPIKDIKEGVILNLKRHPFAFGTRLFKEYDRIKVGASLAFGIDLYKREVIVDPEVDIEQVGENPVKVQLSLIPMTYLSIRLINPVLFVFSLGFEAFLNKNIFQIEVNGEKVILHDLWRFQPIFRIGLCLDYN